MDDVINKLAWVGQKGQELGVDFVIDGGDFFDVKSPQRNSHNLVRAAAEVHRVNYPMPVYALVGNHDVKYGNIDYLSEQPLGVLFASGVFKHFGTDMDIVMEKDGLKVRVVGIPYHGTSYDWEAIRGIVKGDEDYLFVCCHLLASEKGGVGAMYEGEDIVPYSELEGKGVSGWYFGHWHKDQGVVELGDGTVVVNVGSLTRGSLHLDDMDRKPCIVETVVSKDGVKFNRHDVPVRSALEAFKVEQKLDELEDKERMESIVERMKSLFGGKSSTEGLTLIDRVRGLPSGEVSNSVKERAISYLEQTDRGQKKP
jgi:DNA repair exonuclease SbcCD nuclease subunit